MSYFGYQGIHSKNTRYRHPDGTVSHDRPASIIAYHDACAHEVFGVDTTKEGYGSWHHDKPAPNFVDRISEYTAPFCNRSAR